MIDQNRWHTLTLAQQMGNIGSELARARQGESRRDPKVKEAALERALELLDVTMDDPRRRRQFKEINRLREAVRAWYAGEPYYDVPTADLEKYCIEFSLH